MQTIKIISISLFLVGVLCLNTQAQSIDYSIKSNILNPDTLKKGSDEYRIFWHFKNWSFKEVDNIKPLALKAEFEKLGITTKDKEFDFAYSFFKNDIVFHKEQVELWIKHFQNLAPSKKDN